MGKARGLFLAVAGAASLVVACATPWPDFADLDGSPLHEGDFYTTPSQSSSRAGGLPDADETEPTAEVATLAPRTALGSPQAPSLPIDRLSLAQQLQRELARVGCYEGEFNGTWTPTARKAMKAFMDRVNATLPIEEPDYILLSLVQAARDRVCGAGCPTGQGLAEDGRCVPNAILAGKKAPQVARALPPRVEPTPASPGWSVARTSTGATPPVASEEAGIGPAGPTAALNAPGQPAPTPAVAPGASRAAAAKRTAAQPSPLGMIFKQFGF